MLTKTVLLEDLKTTLTYILCQDLEEEERRDMLLSIDDFMKANATLYSKEELLAQFDSAEKILDLFIAFLECRRDMAGQSIH
jgi:uridine kinase